MTADWLLNHWLNTDSLAHYQIADSLLNDSHFELKTNNWFKTDSILTCYWLRTDSELIHYWLSTDLPLTHWLPCRHLLLRRGHTLGFYFEMVSELGPCCLHFLFRGPETGSGDDVFGGCFIFNRCQQEVPAESLLLTVYILFPCESWRTWWSVTSSGSTHPATWWPHDGTAVTSPAGILLEQEVDHSDSVELSPTPCCFWGHCT